MKHGQHGASPGPGVHPAFTVRPLALAALAFLGGVAGPASAQDVAARGDNAPAFEFDTNLMARSSGRQAVDLSRFAYGNPVLPGTYRADVYLNTTWLGRHDITLVATADSRAPAVACLEARWAGRLTVGPQHLSPQARAMLGQQVAPNEGAATVPRCLTLPQMVEGGTAAFDQSEQRLTLTVPQAFVLRNARGYVPPESWTEGVTAATLNYNVNHQQSRSANGSSSQLFVGLDAGLSVNGWHLRHQGSLSRGANGETQYQRMSTSLKRDVRSFNATLTLGDSYTDGQLFDSFGLRGVMLASDDRMLPSSQRGFSPIIRGEARSQAKVQVRQNGVLLYDTTVPPGPFVIDDINPTGMGSDLVVTITEADGSQHGFSLPFSPAPMLLREGHLRYSLAAGTTRNMPLSNTVAQGSVQYGLNNFVTLNGAAVASENYLSLLGGAALNSSWGAWSADYTTSRLSVPGQPAQVGGSLRASWSLRLPTDTYLGFASYRYSSRNFYSLRDANRELYEAAAGGTVVGQATLRARNRVVATVSQSLGQRGSLYVTGASSTYWSTLPRTTTFQIGYAHRFGPLEFSLSAGRETTSGTMPPVNRFSVGISMPLDTQPGRTVYARAQIQNDNLSGTAEQASMSGSFGGEGRVGWGLYGTRSSAGSSAAASLNYRAPLVQLGANFSSGSGNTSTALSASGGLVLHSGGITLAPYLGETIGLVKVENGQDVRVLGVEAAAVDRNGYTVIPYLQPYQLNNVELDFSQASLNLEVDGTNLQAAPTARSVAAFNFTVPAGRVILIKTVLTDGSPAPFGATVLNDKGEQVGAVGQAGKAEARVVDTTGRLTVKWGEHDGQQCAVDYAVPEKKDEARETAHQPMLTSRCTGLPLRAPQQANAERVS